MATDPRTTFLHLYKPIVGDEAGEDLWGEKLNTNFDLIDTFASNQGALTEAPDDGSIYGRQNRAWTETITKTLYDSNFATLTGKDASLATDITTLGNAIIAGDVRDDGQDTAIAGKEPTITAGNPAYFWAGDKTWKAVPASTDSYTKTESDARYEPFDSAYTKAEGDARYEPIDSAYTKAEDDARFEPKITAGDPAMFWAGDKTWKAAGGGGGGAAVTVSDTPPASPTDGMLWLDETGALMVRLNDGTTTQWVQVNAGSTGVATTISTSAPSGGNNGDVWYQVP